jgi:8-oxo-dGTP pyrophosphatase MutT (NUDIX family)
MAVAVLTSGACVLVGRRREGEPSWVFPSGKIELGERPDDAAGHRIDLE